MKDRDLYDKAYGALMGVAVGDAMGMPPEMWPRQKIARHFGKIDTFLPSPQDSALPRKLKAGEVTDDTLITFLVAETIIEQKGAVVPQKLVEKIMAWAEKEKDKSDAVLGPSTKKAFDMIRQGTPVEEAGRYGVTNGGAMRIVPVGIISDWRDLDALLNNVRLVCLATHNTNTAIAGAAAIAAAVSFSMDGDDDLDSILEIARLASEKAMRLGYEVMGASISKRIEMGIEIVRQGKNEEETLQNLYDCIGTGLNTYESVPAALALVCMAQGDPVKCARLAANIGGDTDTIGAMSCGICGALKGIEAFPEEAIKLISEINQLDFSGVAKVLSTFRYKPGR